MAPVGFNVISYISGNLGIGVTARNVVRLLQEKGHPVALYDVFPGEWRCSRDKSLEKLCVGSAEELVHPVNLAVHPPADLGSVIEQLLPVFQKPDRLNAAFSMWELNALPDVYAGVLGAFDALVAESRYIQAAFEFSLPEACVLFARHPLYLPAFAPRPRRSFDLPEDKTVFLTSFDPQSDFERKNPLAVVRAFLAALGDAPDAHLVVKLQNFTVEGKSLPAEEKLLAEAGGHPNVTVLAKNLSYPYVLALYAACDVFVSLHRAEGLGLGPMEAMALGKPVVATAFSGNMTYMDHTNACLVGYRLIPAKGDIPVYRRGFENKNPVWADPDMDEAGAWMRALHENPDLRLAVGERAKAAIAAFHAKAREGSFIDELAAIHSRRDVYAKRIARKRALLSMLNKS